jgi:hypothetical protein
MAAKYTPGPWAWSEDGNSLGPVKKDPQAGAVHTICGEGMECYGYTQSKWEESMDEQRGNRILIEQAPVLFETLRGLLSGHVTKGEAADVLLAILGRLNP